MNINYQKSFVLLLIQGRQQYLLASRAYRSMGYHVIFLHYELADI